MYLEFIFFDELLDKRVEFFLLLNFDFNCAAVRIEKQKIVIHFKGIKVVKSYMINCDNNLCTKNTKMNKFKRKDIIFNYSITTHFNKNKIFFN
jgi:hypothetical protein